MPTPMLKLLAAAGVTSMMVNTGYTKIVAATAASPADRWTYADIADVFGATPLVFRARIARATAVPGSAARPGTMRFYIEGDVLSLIRGPGGLAPKVNWIVDIETDSRGRALKLRGATALVAARPVANRPDMVQLLVSDGQQLWSAALESRVRNIVIALAAPDVVPAVTGIASAFHSPGTVPGEGETQIFLTSATGASMSLSIVSRPGSDKTWSFSQGEIVEDNAPQPAVDTSAWYRLVCFLPDTLPAAATSELGGTDADAARADYAFAKIAIGRCPRTRTR